MNTTVFCGLWAILLLTPIAQTRVTAYAQEEKQTPVVFWHSEPVRPDETVVVVGAKLGSARAILLSRLPDREIGRPETHLTGFPSLAHSLEPIQPSDSSVKFIIPKTEDPGLYVAQVKTAADTSRPFVANRPDVWWVQGDAGLHGTPGGWLRLFGKCLCGADEDKATVVLQGTATATLEGTGDAYQLKVPVPQDLPAGEYQLFVHNGWGGRFGWSIGRKVVIERPEPWPAQVFDVLEFGADKTGAKDSTEAIEKALEAVQKAGGGIVHFPRGRYQITDGLIIPPFAVLRGEKREWVNLFWPDMEKPPDALIKGRNCFGLEELTVYCSNHKHVIASDLGDQPNAGNVFLRKVRVRASLYRGHLKPEEVHKRFVEFQKLSSGGGDTVRLGGRNIEITDCDIYGSGRSFVLGYVRGANVSGNIFRNGRWGWYDIYNSENVIFENNQVVGADLMSTGGGLSSWRGKMPYQQNVYMGHNTFRLMHGWDREAMTSDGGGGAYYGPIASAAADTLTIPDAEQWHAPDLVGMTCFVVWGKGMGQARTVVGATEKSVQLDRRWTLVPDTTSLVSIVMTHRNYLLVDNDFSDCGIGIQFYGTALNHIVAGNRCTRGGGFQGIGKQYGGYDFPPEKAPAHQPDWFIQFLDNEILEGNMYRGGANNAVASGDSVIGVLAWPPKGDWQWPYNLGAVVRRNRLDNNARIQIGGGGGPGLTTVNCVVEHNSISNSDVGIQIDGNASGVVIRKNVFSGVRRPLAGAGAARAFADTKTPRESGRRTQ